MPVRFALAMNGFSSKLAEVTDFLNEVTQDRVPELDRQVKGC